MEVPRPEEAGVPDGYPRQGRVRDLLPHEGRGHKGAGVQPQVGEGPGFSHVGGAFCHAEMGVYRKLLLRRQAGRLCRRLQDQAEDAHELPAPFHRVQQGHLLRHRQQGPSGRREGEESIRQGDELP